MSIQPILIIGLVVAALLYAVAALLYRRKGMSRREWYVTIGAFIAALLTFALLGFFGVLSQSTTAIVAPFVAALSLIPALRRRP
jgi:hypothetical protein